MACEFLWKIPQLLNYLRIPRPFSVNQSRSASKHCEKKKRGQISFFLLLLLLTMEWSLLKMGWNRCWSTAVGWSLQIQILFRPQLSHWAPALQLFHIPTVSRCSPVPRNMLDWLCPVELPVSSRRCFPLKKSLDILWISSLWPRILLFSGKFYFTWLFHLSYTWALFSATLVYSIPKRLVNSELWEVGTVEVGTSFFFFSFPRRLKPLHTNSSTSP